MDYDEAKAGIEGINPAMDVVSSILRNVARSAVAEVAYFLSTMGVDPSTMPVEYLIQAVLIEGQGPFTSVRDEASWMRVFTTHRDITRLLEDNPDLRQLRDDAVRKSRAAMDTPARTGSTPEEFADEVIKSVFGED